MKKKQMMKESGITLIALIITIIIMLILVGVTVNVALNGGLFSITKSAVKQTQIELDRELLSSAVWSSLGGNGEVDFVKLRLNLPKEFTESHGVYTSENNNSFIVDRYGSIETADEELILLYKYFFEENGDGKDIDSLFGEETFNDDPLTITDASTSLMMLDASLLYNVYDGNSNEGYMYIKYNKNVYIVIMDNDFFVAKFIKLVYEPQGREGEKVSYDSNNDGIEEEWMILYDNGENVEMVSINSIGTLTLGANDEEAQGDTNIDKAIYSYNNAITRLNNYCASLVINENKISVRSVGSNPINPSSENNTLYKSEKLENWVEGRYNGVGKSTEIALEQDVIRMTCFGIVGDDNKYWLASRYVYDCPDYIEFKICNSNDDYNTLWSINDRQSDAPNNSSYNTYAVRPVVKVNLDSI